MDTKMKQNIESKAEFRAYIKGKLEYRFNILDKKCAKLILESILNFKIPKVCRYYSKNFKQCTNSNSQNASRSLHSNRESGWWVGDRQKDIGVCKERLAFSNLDSKDSIESKNKNVEQKQVLEYQRDPSPFVTLKAQDDVEKNKIT